MTHQEFFDKIENHRLASSTLLVKPGRHQITRGMAHVISGFVEDLFALFVAEKLNQQSLKYYVDKVISFRPTDNSKAKSFKPDLAIINNGTLTHYFDVKTNMGWNRHFEAYLLEKNNFIGSLKGRQAWIHHGKTNQEKETIHLSKNLKYHMVIIYGWNINQDLLKKNLAAASQFQHVKVSVLYQLQGDSKQYRLHDQAFQEIDETLGI